MAMAMLFNNLSFPNQLLESYFNFSVRVCSALDLSAVTLLNIDGYREIEAFKLLHSFLFITLDFRGFFTGGTSPLPLAYF